MSIMSLTFLGVRGSYPVLSNQFSAYGKNTTCFLFNYGETDLLIDAGTGLNNYRTEKKDIHILLTHPHIDHLLGIMSSMIFWEDKNIHFYAYKFNNLSCEEQIKSLLNPPLWPVKPEMFKAKVFFHDIDKSFYINDIKVDFMLGNHPGGSLVYSLEYNKKKTIVCTDYEYTNDDIITFSKDAYLMLFDAQYTTEEYESRKGFGHSTLEKGLFIKEKANIKKIYFVHHNPLHNDEQIKKIDINKQFAKEGEEFIYE